MTEESIKKEIKWRSNEANRIRTRIDELHEEINEIEVQIGVLEDNLFLIREKEKEK